MLKGNIEKTLRIHMSGIVQGVGFRPFVTNCAKKLQINGTVRNFGGLVEILVSGSRSSLDIFLEKIMLEKPKNSQIYGIQIDEIDYTPYEGFSVIESGESGDIPYITADLPVCDDCIAESENTEDHRYRHPFISCASCGPRYSIIDRTPYDRQNTSMVDFEMCDECAREYIDSSDRRFHAQTVSCFDCGPYLIYRTKEGEKTHEAAFDGAVSALKNGGIVAIKGVGGYHLACSPFNEQALKNLRILKGREAKPFAVMFNNVQKIKEYCSVSVEEESLLHSSARPIVLLLRTTDSMQYEVFRESRYLGAYIAYTALHHMLIEACGPLIMTSANISGNPVMKDDEELFKIDSPLLNGVLYNTRKIRTMLDDSVACISSGGVQLVRRSRGYAPLPVIVKRAVGALPVFASGGDLKSAFCISKEKQFFLSQYFGDMENAVVYDVYAENYERLSKLLHIKPEIAACDTHPAYISSRFAEETGLPLIKVQHHHAHIASVIAEQNIEEPVLGIAFDGTGYGMDGAIWGGEFLFCEGAEFSRMGQLEYSLITGADNAMKDCSISKACLLHSLGLDGYITDDRFDIIERAAKVGIGTVKTSSMGRLFDSVSSILDICQYNAYEGQAAIMLENEAFKAVSSNLPPEKMDFDIIKTSDSYEINAKAVVLSLVNGMEARKSKAALALGFHEALSRAVQTLSVKIKADTGVKVAVLSGGVFQNRILLSQCTELLRSAGFRVFTNRQVPPNDGGISLGQAYIATASFKSEL